MTVPPSEHLVITPSIHYVGTPVMLLATRNPDGTANLSAASSFWALGQHLVIGLETDSRTYDNVSAHPEITVNFPSPQIWEAVERIADTTGRDPVPEAKASRYRHEADKFTVAGLTAVPSQV
ncbi:MAG: flavin reductase, partial [Actinobacteria bacterium HGW-Actinobacteria-8]